jgi:hypothetical protein
MANRNFPARSVDELDFGVSTRQAFGASYEKPKALQRRLDAYWQGKLILPPQPIWQGEPTDWTADPFQDRNWRFQHHTLRWLNPLRWAALDGDDKARQEWLRVVRSWAEVNIPANDSPSDFAWKDMADGNRAIQLSLGAPLLNADDDWFVDLLKYHRDWLSDSNNIVTKNHAMHQHCGLLVVGAVLKDETAVNLAVSRLSELFESTFDNQGANDEGSTGYHQLNTVWWSETWERVRQEGIAPPSNVSDRLDSAATVLAHFSMPNGMLPQIGDGGRTKLRPGLSEGTDFVASGGKIGKRPEQTTLLLERGYIVSRSGWGELKPLADESHTLIRFGEAIHPRTHSHYDRGSVHIYSGGQPWLVDSGFHSYQPSAEENRYLISRESHNIASILRRKHNKDAPVEVVSTNITDQVHDYTLLDHGYAKDNLYRRVLYFVEPDCWIISDNAESEDPVQVIQNWFVEPETVARHLDNGFRLDGVKSSFGMYWLGRGTQLSLVRASEDSLDGWVGTKWRTMVPGSRITAKSRPGYPHLVSLLAHHGEMPFSMIESRVSMNGHIRMHLARGTTTWKINIDESDVDIDRSVISARSIT